MTPGSDRGFLLRRRRFEHTQLLTHRESLQRPLLPPATHVAAHAPKAVLGLPVARQTASQPPEIPMTTTHTIEVRETNRSRARFTAWHNDQEIVSATIQPLLDGARYLLDQGIASPDDQVQTVTRGQGIPCLSGRAGTLAALSVAEGERPPRTIAYRGSERWAQG